MMYADWIDLIREGGMDMLKRIFFPGNARADFMADQVQISGALTLDSLTVLVKVKDEVLHYRLCLEKEG